jgi:valyl-tRNA synthetase
MSKSLGNVIDPHDVISSHGSDALRMGMIAGRSAGLSAAYSPSKITAARNFCNKLWNIARFAEGIIGDNYDYRRNPVPISLADHWILKRLEEATTKISKDLEAYHFSEAYDTLYHTVWDDFADWYIEASKADPNHSLLAYGLETILKLAHPFAPFVTEAIWQTLSWEEGSLLIASSWPQASKADMALAGRFEAIRSLVSEARAVIRNLHLIKPHLYYKGSELLKTHGELIKQLARLEGVSEVEAGTGLHLTQTKENCWLDVDHETARNYLTKLEEQQTAEALSVERLKARLANKSYVDNAPKDLVNETKHQLGEGEQRLKQITAEIDSFTSASQGL